jgi:hypothetical protein
MTYKHIEQVVCLHLFLEHKARDEIDVVGVEHQHKAQRHTRMTDIPHQLTMCVTRMLDEQDGEEDEYSPADDMYDIRPLHQYVLKGFHGKYTNNMDILLLFVSYCFDRVEVCCFLGGIPSEEDTRDGADHER